MADLAQSRLDRIADAHDQTVGAAGITSGYCNECSLPHPCPTRVWATTGRDPITATWDPADDPEPPLTPVQLQGIHEQLQANDPGHDRSTCWCCCADCPDPEPTRAVQEPGV